MRPSEHGGFGLAVVLVTIFLVLIGIFAMIGTQRGTDLRRHAAAGFAGRQAEQIARSAIDEALAGLTPDLLFGSGKMSALGQFDPAFVAELDGDGLVQRNDVGNPVAIRFPASAGCTIQPEALRKLYEVDRSVKKIHAVTVRPVSFSAPNLGVLEVKVQVDVETSGRTTGRVVTEQRKVAFDPMLPNRLRIERASLNPLVLRTGPAPAPITLDK